MKRKKKRPVEGEWLAVNSLLHPSRKRWEPRLYSTRERCLQACKTLNSMFGMDGYEPMQLNNYKKLMIAADVLYK